MMIGKRLKEARLVAGLTQDQVVQRLVDRGFSLSKSALSKYERGAGTPSAQVLLQLSRVFAVKTSYFTREPDAAIQWIAFRKHASLPKNQQERIKAIAHRDAEEHIWLWETFYPDMRPDFPGKSKVNCIDDVENAAKSLRKRWGLGVVPLESVIELVEDKGGIVILSSSAEGEFDGLCGWANELYPVIVSSGAVSADRRRFSGAHELGHLLLETSGFSDKEQEMMANRFAAAFIVPSEAAILELGRQRRNLSLDELALLKAKYGLSIQAWIYRALDLGIIARSQFTALFRRLSIKGWRKNEPHTFHGKEAPVRLRQMRERAKAEGIIPAPEEDTATVSSEEAQTIRKRYPSAAELMELPIEERKDILAKAAAEAEQEYVKNRELTEFEAFGEEDMFDEPE